MTGTSRRHSPAVYRRRRLAVLLGFVLVVAGVVALVVWQPWRAIAAAFTPTPAVSASPSVSPTPEATDAAEATEAADAAPAEPTAAVEEPASEPTPDPTSTEPAIAPCTTADINVYAVTDKESYGAGEQPQLSMTLENEGDVACLMNVGTTTQQFVITSGSDTWWRSTDCQSEPADQVVQIAAGQTVSSVTPLVWDRTRSAVDTCGGQRPNAPAGWYHLQVSIGGIQAADTRMFQLR